MAKVNSILDERMKKPSNTSKMAAMAKKSAEGQLTSFSGVFSFAELSDQEKENLSAILKNYAKDETDIQPDLNFLISLTSEVKAINNQAALLHGERIKKAHQVLTSYKDGAFTAWLIAAYGNRQTPYNLMQYFEFYESLPKQLRPTIEIMPRQAIYVLATRSGDFQKKQEIVEKYQGETKTEMLSLIRKIFPLDKTDKRQQPVSKQLIHGLENMRHLLKEITHSLPPSQKNKILSILKEMQHLITEF